MRAQMHARAHRGRQCACWTWRTRTTETTEAARCDSGPEAAKSAACQRPTRPQARSAHQKRRDESAGRTETRTLRSGRGKSLSTRPSWLREEVSAVSSRVRTARACVGRGRAYLAGMPEPIVPVLRPLRAREQAHEAIVVVCLPARLRTRGSARADCSRYRRAWRRGCKDRVWQSGRGVTEL